MRVVFRVDSSTQMGSGHLMRCLTLAGQLQKKRQTKCFFICRDLPGNLSQMVTQNGHSLKLLPPSVTNKALVGYEKWLTVSQLQDAAEVINYLQQSEKTSCLVVDSYAIDESWEKRVRPYVNKIMVIDDLANRRHDCDILLDQNFYLNKDMRYHGLVPPHCRLQLGPEYALLREEFYEARKEMRERDGKIRNILVFYGGSDLTDETTKAIKALVQLNLPNVTIDVIVGASNKRKSAVQALCKKYTFFRFHCQVCNMAVFMSQADLMLGAGGTTTWERNILKLPAIITVVSDNQLQGTLDCAQAGMLTYIGRAEEVTVSMICHAIEEHIRRRN